MHLFPTCGTKINTFLRLKLHRRRFCCANHNRTRGTPCRLPIVSFSLYHASFHLSLLNLQTGMGNYPFSLFTLPQILRWPRVVFLPVFCLGFSPQHQTSTASKTACRGFKSFCPCHKTGENTGFSPVFFLHVLHCYLVHFGSDFWVPHPSVPAAPLSSTQNAPGFAFFGLFRVRFRIFRRFVGAKFSDWFLCILPYSDHRLKPSVIPCRREVSFLT